MLKYADIIASNIELKAIVDALSVITLKHIEIECLRLHDVMNSADQWQEIRLKYLRDYSADTRLHSHAWYELSCIDIGEIEYYTEESRFTVKNRDLFMMPSGIRHGWVPVTEEYLILGFHLNFRALSITGQKILQGLNESLKSRSFKLNSTALLRESVSNIRTCSRESALDRLALESQILALLYECLDISVGEILCANDSEDAEKNRNQNIARQIAEIIEDKIHLPLQLDDISGHFDLTSRHLNRIFTSEEGISIGKYILKQKMIHACHDLMHTDLSVKSIAYDYGFSQPSYFCRIFKNCYGDSPSGYRLKTTRI